MRVLVFTAKWIGLKCVEYLLDNFTEDQYTIVVGEPDLQLITNELNKRNCKFHLLNEETLAMIRNEKKESYDWLLNLWGGYIFKDDILEKAKNSLNIHPAYLPYCRGRDPVVWAIRYGFPAGVTLHSINAGVDEGEIFCQEQVHYDLPVKGHELYERVVDRSWRLFCEKWSSLRYVYPTVAQPHIPDLRTFRRTDLVQDRVINLDSDEESRKFFLKLLAHDFGENYSAEIILNGKRFSTRLILKNIN